MTLCLICGSKEHMTAYCPGVNGTKDRLKEIERHMKEFNQKAN